MLIVRNKLLAVAVTLGLGATACGSDTKSNVDAMANGIDAAGDARASALPAWKLKDVQPLSPKTGQTYGLDTFNDKIVVVTLLQGF